MKKEKCLKCGEVCFYKSIVKDLQRKFDNFEEFFQPEESVTDDDIR